MGEAERPREKMLSRGPGALSDTELLAILLRGGTPKESALGIARTLLGLTDGRLSALFNMGAEKMMQVPGVGECKAATLLAAMCTRKFRSKPVVAAIFPTIFNMLIVGPVVYFAYVRAPGDPVSIPTLLINMGAVALGELVVCYVLGLPMVAALKKLPDKVLND